jgi:hypothetical protein
MKNKFIKYFVYSIVGIIVLYVVVTVGNTIKISNSESYEIAKDYVKNNESIINQLGEIKKFGSFPSGAIKTINGIEHAQIELSAEGNIKKSNIVVIMEKNGKEWEIKDFYYND